MIGSIADNVWARLKGEVSAHVQQSACLIQPALLDARNAAIYMGRTIKGIRDLERKGILKAVRLDRKLQFRRSDLDEVIERHYA
jgi:hypothetical protein